MSGEDHRFDRRGTDPNVAALALRVTALEERMEQFDAGLQRNTIELRANTALTEKIHGNTEDIVAIVQGLKVFAVVSKYATYIVGFVAAALALFHLKK